MLPILNPYHRAKQTYRERERERERERDKLTIFKIDAFPLSVLESSLSWFKSPLEQLPPTSKPYREPSKKLITVAGEIATVKSLISLSSHSLLLFLTLSI